MEVKGNISDTPNGKKFRRSAEPVTSAIRLRILQQALFDYGLAKTFNDVSLNGEKRLIIVLPGVEQNEHGNFIFVHGKEEK